jgi:2-isopropylmalate synthase
VAKALARGDTWLANRVYSGVPADEFGLCQRIRVGPMSGKSNCVFWLQSHGYDASEDKVERIFKAAKVADHVLTDPEVEAALSSV